MMEISLVDWWVDVKVVDSVVGKEPQRADL